MSQRIIDAFLVDNPELEELSARLAGFNLFSVLKADNSEIRHSNVLAWLLTPDESHGLGQRFLRRFLSRLLLENDQVDTKLTPASVELMDLSDVQVDREWKNIDLLVTSQRGKWALLIENKVHSRESPGQLIRYIQRVREHYAGFDIIPVLLTLDGEAPSEEGEQVGFVPLAYTHVLEVATSIVQQNSSRIPADAQMFMQHYLDVLRRLTMEDEQLANLCKTIYRRHRKAIDLIVKYGSSSQILDEVETAVKSTFDITFAMQYGPRVWFMPKDLAPLCQEVDMTEWQHLPQKFPLTWWIYHSTRNDHVQLTLEVGPIVDGKLRLKLLDQLKSAGLNPGQQAFREKAKFSRVFSLSRKLRINEDGEPIDDPEYIAGLVKNMWEKGLPENEKAVKALKGFKWSS